MEYDWVSLLIFVGIFVLSASPLHRAVRLMKGKTTYFKTLVVMVISGIIVGVMVSLIKVYAGFVAFVLLVFIYQYFFRLKLHRAIFVWVLQLAFVIASSIIVNLAFGVLAGFFS